MYTNKILDLFDVQFQNVFHPQKVTAVEMLHCSQENRAFCNTSFPILRMLSGKKHHYLVLSL